MTPARPATAGRSPFRFRFEIRGLMIAVAGVALILAMPRPMFEGVKALLVVAAVPAVVILTATALAPRGRRSVVASWATVLHPLGILIWLESWRLTWFRQLPIPPGDSLLLSVTLEIPYVVAFLSVVYLLVMFLIGLIAVFGAFRLDWLLQAVAIPVVWVTTWMTLDADPFRLKDWVWN